MLERRKIFHNRFARVSLVFVSMGLALLCALGSLAADAFGAANTSGKRQAASAQYARAEDQRAALNSRPANKRTLAEYKQVVSSYRRVCLITPRAPEVPDALLAVAELYVEMGDRFGRSYYQSAADSYQFLMHQYPASRHAQEALLRFAQLQQDQLSDPALASKTYLDFLKKYPHSPRRREAQEALAELVLLQNSEQPAPSKSAQAGPSSAKPADTAEASRAASAETEPTAASKGSVAHVRRISTSASPDSTRVAIDLEDTVEYSSARIHNPDRIFFDLHGVRLTPELAKASIRVEGDMLTAVRVAQNHAGVVRVVLDVNGVKDYTASLLNHPPELVIDLYRDTAPTRSAKSRSEPEPAAGDVVNLDAATLKPDPKPSATVDAAAVVPDAKPNATGSPVATNTPPGTSRDLTSGGPTAGGAASGSANQRAKPVKAVATKPATTGKPDLIQPPSAPHPTRDGQATLTRALGLKIGRIVIDPGHGGHDTGTIGPTGLMEKDLCLDVALRLGKIVQQRLPGADVMYTRSDDTFIPLEDRTRIANEAKADLFISIHANSSHDHGARGVETYYLNLKGSPDAMEVAARENASAQESIHDLEDVVKRIARNEKIDESREFAADIQESLAKRIQKSYRPVKDRGVRKAPFVVLIGADMPSILTEISFLSNAADEQLLKKPEHRQRVAEGLYQGVASYLQNLNSVTVNLPKLPLKPAGRSTAMVSVEQSHNQQ
jgi:N-acetylmuramoyl-L-alanine amidase